MAKFEPFFSSYFTFTSIFWGSSRLTNKFKVVISILLVLFFCGTAALGSTFIVTKTADTNDGVCDADCSFKEAILSVNANTAGGVIHRIEFSPLFDTPQTLSIDRITIDYNTKVEIIGRGDLNVTITTTPFTANGALEINSDYCKLYNIRFSDCQNELNGGAIVGDDGGDLLIDSCLFEGNAGYAGGAIAVTSFSTFVVKDSTFRNNDGYGFSGGGGGAIYAGNYDQTITGSTFSGNVSEFGSTLRMDGYNITTSLIINSTFSSNTATGGSTIQNWGGTLAIVNTTVAGNTADFEAVVTNVAPFAAASIKNSIVAQNSSGNLGPDVVNAGHNRIDVNPMLGPLADNGGPTETRALLAGSSAIDTGDATGAPLTDQRGVSRPQGAGIDIGAFEVDQTPPFQITTNSNLPAGTVGQSYLLQIAAADGAPPYNFSVTSGSLPTGITLSGDGTLSGTPTQYGTFGFTVTATDANSSVAQKTFQLVIQPAPVQIVNPPGLAETLEKQQYSVQITASGGIPQYTFSQTGGTLPPGLSLSSSGLISGTPTQFGGYVFEVTATDSVGATGQKSLVINVYSALEIWTREDLPTGITNQAYSRQIGAYGGFGPYTYSLESGALPNGFTFSPSGVLSGTAPQSETATFVIKATDSHGFQVQKTFSLTISELRIVTTAQDTNDGICDAHCSLREAITAGDAVPGSSGVVEFSAFFSGADRLYLNSTITISKTTEIRGKGRNRTLISSAHTGVTPKFRIVGTSNATFLDVRMDAGNFSGFSRSIEDQGSGKLTIRNSILSGSISTNINGGAVVKTAGDLLVDNSTFRENSIQGLNLDCSGMGAAIAFTGGSASITNSAFNLNISPAGSIFYGNGTIRIENSTFSYNTASGAICGSPPENATIFSETGSVTLINSTIFQNQVAGSSGSALKGNISIGNSIVAENTRYSSGTAVSPNIGTGVVSLGHNLIGFATGFDPGLPNSNADYVGSAASPLNPLLDPLALNGGETETHAPQVTSLSINNGTQTDAPIADQRGVARPQGTSVDIGAFETDVPVTSAASPEGSNVNVSLGPVSVGFPSVSVEGTTTQVPINPLISGTLPGGFSFGSGLPAFQITTTAEHTSPITVCIQVPGVNSQTIFNSLRLMHSENGALVDRTISRDFPSRTICAQTSSLSPFAIAEALSPTAASVSISGRAVTAEGRGIVGARLYLTDAAGEARSAITGPFGYFAFEGVEAGQAYVLSISAKRFRFSNPTRIITVTDDITQEDFIALE